MNYSGLLQHTFIFNNLFSSFDLSDLQPVILNNFILQILFQRFIGLYRIAVNYRK